VEVGGVVGNIVASEGDEVGLFLFEFLDEFFEEVIFNSGVVVNIGELSDAEAVEGFG